RLLGTRLGLAGRRNLAFLGAPGRGAYAHRPRVAPVAGPATFGGRPGDRRHLHGGAARSIRRASAAPVDGGPVTPPVLPLLSGFLQNLERGDGGGEHLHVAAGGPDDLAYRCPRRRVYALAEGRRAAPGVGGRFRDGQPPERPRPWRIAALGF